MTKFSGSRRSRQKFPNATSIRLTREQRQLLRVAAGFFNLNYQEYMRAVALTHAEHVVRDGLSGAFRLVDGIGKLTPNRRIEILAEDMIEHEGTVKS